jgi:hypothetical protein
MNETDLIALRGRVVHQFAQIETVLDTIVSIRLFGGRISQAFLLDVTSNEYYSWALRLSVFNRIVNRNDWGEGWIDEKALSKLDASLRRLATLRNLFAHAGRVRESLDGVRAYIDPKDSGKELDFSARAKEFDETRANVEPTLETLLRKAFEKYPPHPAIFGEKQT